MYSDFFLSGKLLQKPKLEEWEFGTRCREKKIKKNRTEFTFVTIKLPVMRLFCYHMNIFPFGAMLHFLNSVLERFTKIITH